ncbi:phosphonate ABC transporter ATP-binding protein [Bifidobacterium simiiventris]|uniref:phosphonate ABC transporter ATP-binding protein n=1 Tax=Bifidobacterium simiiventris TaxID=2834434 RepID=UPI001C581291|nr:phosphonate ABC transporter ATP-binding protein [Bifidobacterium simiiventris]MBW3077785.1 phosphonate ABC transporter ATP-binding protein [Bifidobacterium simiiventris]
MMGKDTLLSIRHLSKTYDGKTKALDDVNADFAKGEFVVVIGPSGAGKSTFIRCINRMIDPTSGSMVFDGVHMETLKGRALRIERSHIGMVFQDYNLIDRTSVIKNVLHGCLGRMTFARSLLGLYARDDIREAAELLEHTGLRDQMHKRAGDLSGGQKQRVGICRSLIQHPKLLLADEPIASLDPKSAHVVMDSLVEATGERNLTCLVNLHQVDFAKRYATRIIGIKQGRIVYDGSPRGLDDKTIASIYEGKEEQMTLQGARP